MKPALLLLSIFLGIVVVACQGTNRGEGEIQGIAPVQVSKTYKVLIGMGAMRFKVLELGQGGMAKVQAVNNGSFIGIRRGEVYWLNLNQALLVEAVE